MYHENGETNKFFTRDFQKATKSIQCSCGHTVVLEKRRKSIIHISGGKNESAFFQVGWIEPFSAVAIQF